MIKIFLGVCITVDFRGVATPLDVDEERSVLHSVLHTSGLTSVRIQLKYCFLLSFNISYSLIF